VKVFINNPHSFDMLSIPVSYFLIRKRPHLKYRHFFEKLLNEGALICVDFSETSFRRWGRFSFLLPPFVFFETLIWCLINKISITKVHFGSVPSGAKLVVFTYKGATEFNNFKRKSFDNSSAIYWHLSHFMISSQEKAQVINGYSQKSTLLCDSDMNQNPYLESLRMENLPILLVPFVPGERFVATGRERRGDKLLSVGSFHKLELFNNVRYFCDFYRANSYHFVRSEIAAEKPDWVFNVAELRSGLPGSDSFDMVDMLNSFKYVVCGDELWGAPAIGNFEAMACGALPILVEENYLGMGLKEGLDFVGYDGTLEGLFQVFHMFDRNRKAFDEGIESRLSIRGRLSSVLDKSVASIID